MNKGYQYTLISLLFLIVWPIFAKLGFGYFNFQTTTVLWFWSAAVFSFLMILFSGRIREYKTFITHWRWIILVGISGSIGVLGSFYALDLLGAGLHNFLSKTSVVFILFSGVLFLRERFTRYEALSAIIILIGLLLISYTRDATSLRGIIVLIISLLFFTIQLIIIKTKLHDINSLIIVNYRALSVGIISLVFALITNKIYIYWSIGLLYATIPSILSAVFAHIFIFEAYKLVEMSKVELILSVQPFLVLILSYLVFGEMFALRQFIGGSLIIAGVIGLVYFKNFKTVSKTFPSST